MARALFRNLSNWNYFASFIDIFGVVVYTVCICSVALLTLKDYSRGIWNRTYSAPHEGMPKALKVRDQLFL